MYQCKKIIELSFVTLINNRFISIKTLINNRFFSVTLYSDGQEGKGGNATEPECSPVYKLCK